MTKARNIADLLDANGDVKTASLDNVPASNDASALTTGTLPNARLPNNISDGGTTGTKVANGTTAQRGSTTGEWRFNSTTGKFEGRGASGFVSLEATPSISSVNVSNITQKQIDDGFDLIITGQNFATGDVIKFIGSDNTAFTSPTVTINSGTQITARVTSNIDATKEPYQVEITSTGGLTGSLTSAFNIDASPVWSTTAGNIGNIDEGSSTNITISATDSESDTIAYTETGGSVLSGAGFSLNSSTGAITGTAPDVSGSATYSFNARATSGTNFTDRAFNIIVSEPPTGGNSTGTYSYGGTTYSFHKFTSNGNFILPVTKSVDIFLIGGGGGTGGDNSGGGGAGGLIWRHSLNLSASTYAIVVGNGGNGTSAGSQASGGAQGSNSTFGSLLTALGAGFGGDSSQQPSTGGSGGGGGRYGNPGAGGTQTSDGTISADSRTYGFGFAGGNGNSGSEGPGGGGGGTGAVGVNASNGTVGNGGVGNSTFVGDAASTTAFLLGTVSGTNGSNSATTNSSSGTLYIGGGGSGGTQNRGSHGGGGLGGYGGGANIGGNNSGNDGMTNTGSGGSSTTSGSGSGGDGGSGLVIVRYS